MIAVCFLVVSWTIFRDYDLRVHHAWNGSTGSTAGIAAHRANVSLANLATNGIQLLTAGVAGLLVWPRRDEARWFRWSGWLGLVFAGIFVVLSLVGVLGASLHAAYFQFDPSVAMDGSAAASPHALSPAAWRVSYFIALAVGSFAVAAILAASIGARWLIWAVRSLAAPSR